MNAAVMATFVRSAEEQMILPPDLAEMLPVKGETALLKKLLQMNRTAMK